MPTETETRRVGRPRFIFGQQEVDGILAMLRLGHGRTMACALRKIGYRHFLMHLREYPIFAEQVREIEKSRVESCEYEILHLARSSSSESIRLRAAISYVHRRDKASELLRARRVKARAAKRAKLALATADIVN